MASPESVSVSSFVALKEELNSVRKELHAKDEEIERLSRIRADVQAELEELTASLFEEAHRMVREANIKENTAQKSLNEANMKIDVLQTEVQALKALVITSTPANPNPHLHPQIDRQRAKHRKESSSDSVDQCCSSSSSSSSSTPSSAPQVDPCFRELYLTWQRSPSLANLENLNQTSAEKEDGDEEKCSFLGILMQNDILPCLQFPNKSLSSRLLSAVMNESVYLAPLSESEQNCHNECSLLWADAKPRFGLKLESSEDDECFFVSQLARNRIAAVCDCVTYLRYITRGLVKSDSNQVYWRLMHLRKSMQLARLGFVNDDQ